MEDAIIQNLKKAVWYKLTKDRTVQLIPVFTDYSATTRIGATLYDQDVVPCKIARELISQSQDEMRAWYFNIDADNIESIRAAGISIPAEIETVDSLAQLRSLFNRQTALH